MMKSSNSPKKNVNIHHNVQQQWQKKNIAAQTVRAQADSDIDFSKVKRNDLCPCGSGKIQN